MKYKSRKKIKRYFVYTSVILHLYFLTFFEMKYTNNYTSELQKKYIRKSTSNTHSGHPPPPFSKRGVEIQAKISERVGLKNFWIKGGELSLNEGGGVKISRWRGGGIPGHNFPFISNFIFSFSQKMTFFIFSLFSEVKMRNLVYCFNVTSTFLTFNFIFFNMV